MGMEFESASSVLRVAVTNTARSSRSDKSRHATVTHGVNRISGSASTFASMLTLMKAGRKGGGTRVDFVSMCAGKRGSATSDRWTKHTCSGGRATVPYGHGATLAAFAAGMPHRIGQRQMVGLARQHPRSFRPRSTC